MTQLPAPFSEEESIWKRDQETEKAAELWARGFSMERRDWRSKPKDDPK